MARLSNQRDEGANERQSLLPQREQNGGIRKPTSSSSSATGTSLASFINKNIDTERADLPLIVSFFISGMIDAGAYNAYECFSSMQARLLNHPIITGNTVFAALGISDLPVSTPKLAWVKSVTSILAFLLGSVLLTTLHHKLGSTKRWVLCLSFLVQAVMIAVSAVLVRLGQSSGSPVGGGKSEHDQAMMVAASIPKYPGYPWTDLLPIGFLSFQAAGKVVASRVTGQTGLPVVVLTTLYNDLISDPALFTAGLMGNIPRNRKTGGLVLYFVGATCGGVAASSSIGFSGGLAICCAVQVSVAIAWLVWFEEKDDSEGQ